jgi:hypothetical protein
MGLAANMDPNILNAAYVPQNVPGPGGQDFELVEIGAKDLDRVIALDA